MMSVVYNYIRVDTTNFLSNTSYVEVVIEMSKAVSQWACILMVNHVKIC